MSTFQKFVENLGYDTRRYSGRAMFRKECLAITVEDNPLQAVWDIAYALAEENTDRIENDEQEIRQPRSVKWDNMGLQYVIYWPGVEYEE